ncbi:MAG: 3-deoxy-manno-octulosonate-8-phosphatase KdsC [Thiolinea sp.]
MEQIREKASQIKLVIFDVDGVLTDGSLFYDNQGQEYKAFNSRDGHGIRMLQDGGIKMAILTGRKSELVMHRAQNLGIDPELIYQGYRDKRPAFAELCTKTGIQHNEIAYVGDDVIDLPVMSKVGLAIAVADAHPFVKQHAHWVTGTPGGKGAAREVCETLLDAQGKLQSMLETYLN